MITNLLLIIALFSALGFANPLSSAPTPKQETVQKKAVIATLDLDDIYKDAKTRTLFIEQFGQALHTNGFVQIKNHHISKEKIDSALKSAKQFFELPDSTKQNYQEVTLNRGYRGYDPERADKKSDPQEYWHVGPLANNDTPTADWPKIAANVWPTEIDQFQTHLSELYQEIAEKGQPILAVASVYMGKETPFLSKITEHGDSVMRVVHYLPSQTETDDTRWKAPHRDPNLLTMIVGASMEGLEVQTREGNWVSVPYDPDTIIVSVSDMLESLSNGLYRSAPHRVTIKQANTSRFAIPFFYHVQRNLSIAPVKESILQTGSKPLYPDQTAEDALKTHNWFESSKK